MDDDNIYITWKMVATALAVILIALIGVIFDRTASDLEKLEVKQEKVIGKVGIE